VLHGVKAWAIGEHPAGKDALDLSGELDLVHLDKGCGVGRLGGRAGIANPRRHFQRAELHRLIDRNFQMRDAPRHLVESGKHGDLILDGFGTRSGHAKHRGRGNETEQQSKVGGSRFEPLHHAQRLLNRNTPLTPAFPLVGQGLNHESGIGVARTMRPALTQPAPRQNAA